MSSMAKLRYSRWCFITSWRVFYKCLQLLKCLVNSIYRWLKLKVFWKSRQFWHSTFTVWVKNSGLKIALLWWYVAKGLSGETQRDPCNQSCMWSVIYLLRCAVVSLCCPLLCLVFLLYHLICLSNKIVFDGFLKLSPNFFRRDIYLLSRLRRRSAW